MTENTLEKDVGQLARAMSGSNVASQVPRVSSSRTSSTLSTKKSYHETFNAADLEKGRQKVPSHIPPNDASMSANSAFEAQEKTAADDADLETELAEERSGLPLSRASTRRTAMENEKDPFLVTLEGRDSSLNPHRWNSKYRWALTGLAGLLVLNATFASSAPSNLIPNIIEHYNVSQEVGVLTISIFVAGYCLGPLIFGPLSERYGRRIVLVYSFIPYTLFQIGCALAPNIGSLLVFRFLAGCFASSPLTASGGLIADLWDADRRGDGMAVFSLMPTCGPALAPIISGYFHVAGVNWRWIFWLLLIFAGVCWLLMVVFLPETYVPYILVQEAKRVRKETGDTRYYAALERRGGSLMDILKNTIFKPFIMIIEEPMLLTLTLYLSFVYGVIYLLFEAVPIIFIGNHHLNAGESGLVFLAVLVGAVTACFFQVFYFNPKYKQEHHRIKKEGKFMVPPEYRLIPVMVSAPLLAISFFWVAFTSYPSISIASPIIALYLFGICVLFIFLGVFNYLIDAYLVNAASALAINTVVRSAFGAGFPLFAGQMYHRLGVPGASGLLAGIAVAFVPAPFLLYKYGKAIRMMSKNAHVLE